jgi:tyrosinase
VTGVTPLGSSIQGASVSPQAVAPRLRRSITQLLPGQLEGLKRAFELMQELRDDRGYQHHAGLHGLPLPKYCKVAHGQPVFLAWHRAYLYVFELALRDAAARENIPGVALAWWDWRTVRDIPAAFLDIGGALNPLASVQINDLALQQGLVDQEGSPAAQARTHALARIPNTFREPGRPGTRPLPTEADVDDLLDRDDFLDFQNALEDFHGDVHIWVGGHMSSIPFAAYDPIFWAHHAMVDRIWRLWQLKHPHAPHPPALLGRALEPFALTVRETLDVTSLGFDYAVTTAHDLKLD